MMWFHDVEFFAGFSVQEVKRIGEMPDIESLVLFYFRNFIIKLLYFEGFVRKSLGEFSYLGRCIWKLVDAVGLGIMLLHLNLSKEQLKATWMFMDDWLWYMILSVLYFRMTRQI